MDNEPVVEFAMRSRIGRTGSDGERGERRSGNGTAGSYAPEIVLVEKPIKPGDTLNKLSIQYAVNVAEIKRANNLVSDQDFLALTKIKIPLSRLRLAMVSSTSEDDEDVLDSTERTHLIDENLHTREPSVEDILRKTDTNIAQVKRNNCFYFQFC
ncbi:hypothetical protein WR25_04259 isoform B [Diploscapter pachys]|uniref:LysM domain-containing protein n=1 Tax=Diploscapter pachys TaxID=2018661 RepID=A0A2A2K1G5_9BILA|nr:hypothetical protein WR25_04259 isoform B [Diploscapter pachys]